MQPFELVIAIMIADLASIPMADTGIPISNGVIPIIRTISIATNNSKLKFKECF